MLINLRTKSFCHLTDTFLIKSGLGHVIYATFSNFDTNTDRLTCVEHTVYSLAVVL